MGIPFIRDFDFAHGRADQLSDRIIRVIANNPGPFTFTGSGTYLVGDRHGVAAIDPGPDNEAHVEAILAAAPGPITHILVTHTHLDHCGGTARLKARTGAEVLSLGGHPSPEHAAPPALDEGADFSFRPDRVIEDGERIELPSAMLAAVHTPGHCANHLCFALDDEGTLFTGDHMMGWSTTVVAPPDGNMDDYMASLDILLSRKDMSYLPTHGAPITNPAHFVSAVKEHREARDHAIISALGTAPQSAIDIAKRVYTDIDARMLFAAALNVTAHLESHQRRGMVEKDEAGGWRRV